MGEKAVYGDRRRHVKKNVYRRSGAAVGYFDFFCEKAHASVVNGRGGGSDK